MSFRRRSTCCSKTVGRNPFAESRCRCSRRHAEHRRGESRLHGSPEESGDCRPRDFRGRRDATVGTRPELSHTPSAQMPAWRQLETNASFPFQNQAKTQDMNSGIGSFCRSIDRVSGGTTNSCETARILAPVPVRASGRNAATARAQAFKRVFRSGCLAVHKTEQRAA